MSNLLTTALGYAERGWNVFPLRPDDKRPAFPGHAEDDCTQREHRCRTAGRHVGWEERATTDPDRIRRAWSAAPYNVGVACGPSNLIVIDLDMPKPDTGNPPPEWDGCRDGVDVFGTLCERHGHPFPYDTYTVRTGRGGLHLYFAHPTTGPQLRNTQGDKAGGLGWLIDTRAHGGYVVAAGSTAAGLPYTVDLNTDPAPLDDWLAELLRPAPLPPQRPVKVDLGTGRQAAYLEAAISRQVAHLEAATEGTRNHTLYLSAVALGQLAAGGALTDDDVCAVLEPAARRIGLSEFEINRTIRSGLRAGARRPRSVAA